MSLNSTPNADRTHIAFFGRRNAGKSSVINAVTGQSLSIVSDVLGTTTDPVYKAMELLPLGPVVMIDTPGLDDTGELGKLRVQKSYQVLHKTDIAVLVADATVGLQEEERALMRRFAEMNIPYVVVYNKADIGSLPPTLAANELAVCALSGQGVHALKELIARQVPSTDPNKRIVGDLLCPGDFVVMVVPIDSAAPKGRLILPQQQTIRDILEADATAVVVKENGLADTLNKLGAPPRMVITDSQAFEQVSRIVPPQVPLTSFSILLARYKGFLAPAVAGVAAVDTLRNGDKVLISEGCTHHRQCDDIGTVKLPRWIRAHIGQTPDFHFTSGREYQDDLTNYKLVIHCGGCMLNEREMQYRIGCATEQGVPVTNYGILIAYMQGILQRSLSPLPGMAELLNT